MIERVLKMLLSILALGFGAVLICGYVFGVILLLILCSDSFDANTMLENSLNAKDKIISELNTELHNIETTLSNEREYHLNELKKLKALLNEKVVTVVFHY